MTNVLVTGGSGFIAGHCVLQLVAAGHEVRATVRSLAREGVVRATLGRAGLADGSRLSFVAADLLSDDGWAEAMRGVDTVLHVASPVAPGHVENEDDVIVPAREGTLRVLRTAKAAGVRRVVMTSAFHAVAWGHPHDDRVFTEADWTDVSGPGVDAYGRSKTLAEQAAWDAVAEAGGPELVTMLPVAVMGPALGGEVSGANQVVELLLDGAMPALPHIWFPIVDVRDVARAHVLAMETPEAAGERFLLSAGPAMELPEIAGVLRAELGDDAVKVPRRTLPNFVVRLAGLFNPEMRSVAAELGYARRASNDSARRVLAWEPRPSREAVIAAARSLVERG